MLQYLHTVHLIVTKLRYHLVVQSGKTVRKCVTIILTSFIKYITMLQETSYMWYWNFYTDTDMLIIYNWPYIIKCMDAQIIAKITSIYLLVNKRQYKNYSDDWVMQIKMITMYSNLIITKQGIYILMASCICGGQEWYGRKPKDLKFYNKSYS